MKLVGTCCRRRAVARSDAPSPEGGTGNLSGGKRRWRAGDCFVAAATQSITLGRAIARHSSKLAPPFCMQDWTIGRPTVSRQRVRSSPPTWKGCEEDSVLKSARERSAAPNHRFAAAAREYPPGILARRVLTLGKKRRVAARRLCPSIVPSRQNMLHESRNGTGKPAACQVAARPGLECAALVLDRAVRSAQSGDRTPLRVPADAPPDTQPRVPHCPAACERTENFVSAMIRACGSNGFPMI